MNDIIEQHYIKYFECLSTNDKDICDNMYLNSPTPLITKKQVEQQGKKQAHKNTWRFVNRGNFLKK